MTNTVVGFAFAYILNAYALIAWNIGTRSPGRAWAEVRTSLRTGDGIGRGAARFFTGGLALLLAATLVGSRVHRPYDFTVIESLGILTALIVEALVGPAVRKRFSL